MFVVGKRSKVTIMRRVIVPKNKGTIGMLVMELIHEAFDIPQAYLFDLFDNRQH